MASFDNNTITLKGRKLLVSSLTGGGSIEFTHFSIGDGATPDAPENQEALVHELFTVPVSKTTASDKENGVTLVRGSFKNSGSMGDFYWRELGIYARISGSDNEPMLFGYINTGESADYIPTVGIGSVITQSILLQIVTGSASVLYVSDPTSAATLQDIDDCLATVEAKLSAFSAEHLASIQAQISTLQNDITKAINELNKATEGYVLKAGDTMTGDLRMSSGKKLIGDLDGSASMWGGWTFFSGLSELNSYAGKSFDDSAKMLAIGQAMPALSRLVHMTGNVVTVKNDGFPDVGLLEIVKFGDTRCSYTFTTTEGRRYHSASTETEPKWKGWTLAEAPLIGSIQMFAGADAPNGYLLCHGQSLSRFAYPELYAVIGTTYGGSGDTFNLPDFRGLFPRGLDAGRGIDSGRKLGTSQNSGAPNIVGEFTSHNTDEPSGVFSTVKYSSTGGGAGNWGNHLVRFDASRSSAVYQDGLTEVRPANIAVNFIIKY